MKKIIFTSIVSFIVYSSYVFPMISNELDNVDRTDNSLKQRDHLYDHNINYYSIEGCISNLKEYNKDLPNSKLRYGIMIYDGDSNE